MKQSNTLRTIGGLSAFAVVAGFAVTLGGGIADAAPGSIAWVDGNSNYVRTISNVTPAEGEVITISTQFKRSSSEEKVTAMKDVHPDCLTFVGLKIDGTPTALTNSDPTFARVVGEWYVNPNLSRTMEYSYKVGANCVRNVALNTYMDYSGNLGQGNYLNKGPTISVTRNSTTVLATAPAGVKVGQSVPLSATVTGGVDGDIVEFFDGTTKLGQGPLTSGTAIFTWTPTTGAHSLTAKFVGTAVTGPSASAAQNVPASPADVATTTAVTGPTTAVVGADVTLNVQVTPIPSGGTVQFKDGGSDIGSPVTLDSEGKGSLTEQFATGTRTITAVYSGINEYQGSTSTAHTVTMSPANIDTSTTLAVSGPSTVGQAMTFKATVGPTGANGTVQFKAGATEIGGPVAVVDGVATLPHTFDAAGTYGITAEFSGDAGFADSISGPTVITVVGATDPGTPGGTGSANFGSLTNLFGS